MKKIKVVLLLLSNLLFAQTITFQQFTEMVSQDVKRNIFLDKDIKNYKMDLFIPDHLKSGELYEMYKNVLFEHDLKLQFNKRGKFYFVSRLLDKPKYINPDKELHYYSYKIKNITNEDVLAVMKIFPTVHFSYLKQSDIIAYSCTKSVHQQVKQLLKKADNKVRSKTIKITIFTVNKDKVLSYGSKISKFGLEAGYSADNFVSSLISSSIKSFDLVDRASFFFTLYALQSHGYAKIQQAPTMLITNGKKTMVNSVLNIPYKVSTVTQKENTTTTRDQIKYRDVGLVVSVNPKIKNDSVFLDLRLISEELLSTKDDKPLTQKITYQNFVTVTKNHPVLLTGIKKVSQTIEKGGVPVLSDLPLVGGLFKNQTNKNNELSINIMIELVDNSTKIYSDRDFNLKNVSKPKSKVRGKCTDAMTLLGFRRCK